MDVAKNPHTTSETSTTGSIDCNSPGFLLESPETGSHAAYSFSSWFPLLVCLGFPETTSRRHDPEVKVTGLVGMCYEEEQQVPRSRRNPDGLDNTQNASATSQWSPV